MESLVCKGTHAWDMNKRNKQQSLAYGCTHKHHLIFDFFQKYMLTFMRGFKKQARAEIAQSLWTSTFCLLFKPSQLGLKNLCLNCQMHNLQSLNGP